MIVGSLTGRRPWVILGAVHSVRHWKLKKDPKKLNSVDTEIWASRNCLLISRFGSLAFLPPSPVLPSLSHVSLSLLFSSDFRPSSTTRRPVFNSLVLLPNAFPLSLSPCPLHFLSYPFRSSSSKKRWRRRRRFEMSYSCFVFFPLTGNR